MQATTRSPTEVVAVDLGGTHARFALARLESGRVVDLSEEAVLKTAEHANLRTAWDAYEARLGRPLPRACGIAVAGPIHGDTLKLTNNPWVIRPARLPSELGVEQLTIINDFAAVAHAVAQMGPSHLAHLCGPERPLPAVGVITIMGPGTGLGVALLLKNEHSYRVVATEGGHVDFAPLDSLEDAILGRLRARYRRVSVERIVAGPGLANIYEALAAIEGRPMAPASDAALWTAALAGTDTLAAAALDRFCLSLGSVAGDLALAHGAGSVVIGGGVGLRLADRLPRSGFSERFVAKGRFEALMGSIPVKLILHPQPGLLGAAAAFAEEHRSVEVPPPA